jgi:hypothetical protein
VIRWPRPKPRESRVAGLSLSAPKRTRTSTRESPDKALNLRQNPQIAFVIGGTTVGDERTVQYEGIADEPAGAELERLKELYFESFPDGRERDSWPGITYIRTKPTWVRYTDFNQDPPATIEFDLGDLGGSD